MEERFIADRNLGTLAKWLRILGYDTLYSRTGPDRDVLEKGAHEGRILLTRKRDRDDIAYKGRLVGVKADRVGEQIGEVLDALALTPEPGKRMTRCLLCNVPLTEVPRERVQGLVPLYVYETQRLFRRCDNCGRIFWPGTHPQHVEEYLRTRIPPGHA